MESVLCQRIKIDFHGAAQIAEANLLQKSRVYGLLVMSKVSSYSGKSFERQIILSGLRKAFPSNFFSSKNNAAKTFYF